GERVTTMREIGPPGINAWRIAELEQLASTVGPRPAPRDVAARLAIIESTASRYSSVTIAAAVGAASAGFAFLNGAATREMIAAAMGGAIGQWSRLWMSHRQLNQYGAAALSAIAASGIYVLVAALARYAGLGFAHYPAGFIASVLFLIPGFPLIAGLFDLLQYQTIAAVSRLAYGVMILLVVAFGLSIVVELARIDLSRQPPLELIYPLKLLLRAVASFAAGGAFAMLFNSPPRTILAAGALALGANSLRLVLNDMGMMIAPASFFAALAIGLVAVLVDQHSTCRAWR
ncbi:MAG: threonine/serine exporter family protein, partial [Pseudolabrys sp.]